VSLTARQKAAILLVSLPPEVSAQVFREFAPEEVQQISLEISKLPQISPEVRAQIIQEFLQTTDFPAAKELAGSFSAAGFERGSSASQMGSGSRTRPLEFLRGVDPKQLLLIIRKEHPQTIALVLNYLPPQQASALLGELPAPLQSDVAGRLAEIDKISPEILQEIEKVLESRLFSVVEGEYLNYDGKEALMEILSQTDRSTEEKIISGLTQKIPHIAEDIKTKMCDFEDLNNIDDSSLHQVLRLTDIRDLVLALKGADPRLAERIYSCMAPEVAKALREDVQSLGQVPWDEIKTAQQQIRNILRGLVTLGKLKFKN
jgi:flagellar motor switch protein FliG